MRRKESTWVSGRSTAWRPVPTLLLLVLAGVAVGCGPGADSGSTEVAEPPGAPASLRFVQEVSWSPDGARLVFSRLDIETMVYRVFRIEADGTGLVALTEGPRDLWTSWSPDGIKIAFGSTRSDNADVFVMNADGSEPVRLTDHPAADGEPAWSPDGGSIAFTSEREGERRVYVMNADGSDQRRIGSGPGREYAPRWSPDGMRIAFYAATAPGEDRIFLMNSDGSGRTELAEGVWPSWSPDGSAILFPARDEGLVAMRADGAERRILVGGDVVLGEWSPDGDRIAFVRVTWNAPEGWPAASAIFLANADGSGAVSLTGRERHAPPRP